MPRPTAWPAVASTAGLELHAGDGRSLPYPDRSFDIAHASLVLHHLAPDDAVALLREMARVARLGIVVNDLDRSRLGLLGAWLVGHLATRNRYTRHDAPLSVRRAYRADEMTALLVEAGLDPGPYRPRRPRPALRHRRPAEMSERVGVAIVGGGPCRRGAGSAAHGRRRTRRRPGASTGLALAGRRGLRVACRGRRTPARSAWRRRRSRPSPGRSRPCAWRRPAASRFD